jgi:AraC-like DNA-binding protein
MTAHPFLSANHYIECLPCDALKPFISCFWGTQEPLCDKETIVSKPTLVIPDTCMDIIFMIDSATNTVSAHYIGISDEPFLAHANSQVSVSCFAIRFHFWAVHLFADTSIQNSLNTSQDIEFYFSGWKNYFENMLTQTHTLSERITMSEKFLLSKLNLDKCNTNVLNAIYCILKSNGTQPIKEVSAYTVLSQRQLERLFLKHIGISAKKVSNLVRYQKVWQDVLYSQNFNVYDAVEKYRYTDQSHLLNEFTKYHSVTPTQAKNLAHNRISTTICSNIL